jgi:hypothetical protein
MERDYGTVTFKGKTYKLIQDAYVDNYGTNGAVRYYVKAIGEDYKTYLVTWETTEKFDDACRLAYLDARYEDEEDDLPQVLIEERYALYEKYDNDPPSSTYAEDEGNACDWDNPISVESIE